MKAIRSTRQVTKAMELVAASKMRRATQNAVLLRRYATVAWRILERLAEIHPELHPALQERPATKVLAILFTSDRGLCGNLNASMTRMAAKYIRSIKDIETVKTIDFIAIGKKGQHFLAKSGVNIVAAFGAIAGHPKIKDILPATRMALQGFNEMRYDHVVLLYPDFISALVQEPTVKVLLPLSKAELQKMITNILPMKRRAEESLSVDKTSVSEYLFEPSQDEVLATILPKLTEMQIFQAALEAMASEHSARMVAMRNASENASDILSDLTLTYNQTRQAGITAELAEISGAAVALG